MTLTPTLHPSRNAPCQAPDSPTTTSQARGAGPGTPPPCRQHAGTIEASGRALQCSRPAVPACVALFPDSCSHRSLPYLIPHVPGFQPTLGEVSRVARPAQAGVAVPTRKCRCCSTGPPRREAGGGQEARLGVSRPFGRAAEARGDAATPSRQKEGASVDQPTHSVAGAHVCAHPPTADWERHGSELGARSAVRLPSQVLTGHTCKRRHIPLAQELFAAIRSVADPLAEMETEAPRLNVREGRRGSGSGPALCCLTALFTDSAIDDDRGGCD
jgi:hypothetical protein